MKPRGRPRKPRKVMLSPKITQFSPRGRPGRPEEVNLGMDEFEAIRLVDLLRLSQKQAAESMGISQQTVSRVLKSARKILAQAVIDGKIIRIMAQQV